MSVSAVYLPDFAHQQSLLGPEGTKRKGTCHELSPRAVRRFPRMAGPAETGLAGARTRMANGNIGKDSSRRVGRVSRVGKPSNRAGRDSESRTTTSSGRF